MITMISIIITINITSIINIINHDDPPIDRRHNLFCDGWLNHPVELGHHGHRRFQILWKQHEATTHEWTYGPSGWSLWQRSRQMPRSHETIWQWLFVCTVYIYIYIWESPGTQNNCTLRGAPVFLELEPTEMNRWFVSSLCKGPCKANLVTLLDFEKEWMGYIQAGFPRHHSNKHKHSKYYI